MYRRTNISNVVISSLLASINIVGSFIATSLKLPVYLDSMGTILSSMLLGPIYGVCTGITSGIISGISFDVYSFYFIPVQILLGLLTGIIYKRGYIKGYKIFVSTLLISIPSSIIASIIASYIFGGVTSSGSSYIVQLLSSLGVNKVYSVFVTQIWTDYLDKLISIYLMLVVLNRLPNYIKINKSSIGLEIK